MARPEGLDVELTLKRIIPLLKVEARMKGDRVAPILLDAQAALMKAEEWEAGSLLAALATIRLHRPELFTVCAQTIDDLIAAPSEQVAAQVEASGYVRPGEKTTEALRRMTDELEARGIVSFAQSCSEENPCCDRRNEYNGFGSDGPRLFACPKRCSCHD